MKYIYIYYFFILLYTQDVFHLFDSNLEYFVKWLIFTFLLSENVSKYQKDTENAPSGEILSQYIHLNL